MLPLALSIDGGSLTYAAAAQRKVIISYFFRIKEVVIVERLLDFLISDFFLHIQCCSRFSLEHSRAYSHTSTPLNVSCYCAGAQFTTFDVKEHAITPFLIRINRTHLFKLNLIDQIRMDSKDT